MSLLIEGGWTRWPLKVLSTQTILWFYVVQVCKKLSTRPTTPSELSGHLFAPKPPDRAPHLSGTSAHKMSQQLIVLAIISGLLGHAEIISICHSDQEVWHVVKCLVVKNCEKGSRSRSGNSSQKTQRMPLKTKQSSQQEKTQHYAIRHFNNENYASKNAWSFLVVRWRLAYFHILKESTKNNQRQCTIFEIKFYVTYRSRQYR